MTLIVVLSVLWLIVLWRLPALRKSPPQRTSTFILLFLAGSTTMVHRGIRRTVDTTAGIPDLSILLGHLFALLAVISALEFAAAVTDASRSQRAPLRRGEIAIAAAAACMVGLFVAIPRRVDQPDFGYWHGKDIEVVTYQMLFQVSVGVALCLSLPFLVRHWRSAPPGPLRTALLLLWLAVAIAIPYVLNRMWATVWQGLGGAPVNDPLYTVSTSLILQVALLLAALSALIPLTYRCGAYLRRLQTYHRLGGLWTTLTNAVPHTVLTPPPHPLISILSFRSMELLLYRRAVEIRDAQVELTSKVPTAMRDNARAVLRQHGYDDELALDACTLHIALHITQANPTPSPEAPYWATATELDGEVANLLELSNLMRTTTISDIAAGIAATDRQELR